MATKNINPATGKRYRATPAEMIARKLAEIEALKAKAEGTYTPDAETLTVKRVRNARRKRETLLDRAKIMLNGRVAGDGKIAQSSIDAKIEQAEKRLADLRLSKANAEERVANLPFDIERLAVLLERAEKGETIEFPADLTPIPGEGEGTDTEKEVAAADGAND